MAGAIVDGDSTVVADADGGGVAEGNEDGNPDESDPDESDPDDPDDKGAADDGVPEPLGCAVGLAALWELPDPVQP